MTLREQQIKERLRGTNVEITRAHCSSVITARLAGNHLERDLIRRLRKDLGDIVVHSQGTEKHPQKPQITTAVWVKFSTK